MDERTPAQARDVYAGWLMARNYLLKDSIGRVYALLAASAVDDEAWRSALGGETMLWQAIRDSAAVPVPPGWEILHRRNGEVLALLGEAGDGLRTAVAERDTGLLARSMSRLDAAEKKARSAFAAAFALSNDPDRGR